jgi:hypothetical protein
MKTASRMISAAFLLCAVTRATCEPSAAAAKQATQPDPASSGPVALAGDAAKRADKRYEEMLDRMQAAVEEVAELYGNPVFLQVFTNDAGRAMELKQRLKAAQTGDEVSRELTGLGKKRDDLLGDIALKEREAARLNTKLVRQRAALDALASAIDQARKAVEDTSK